MHLALSTALLALAPGLQDEARGGDPKTLEAVPANALAALSLAPLDELRERAKTNAWFRLAQDEECAPLFAKVGELVDRSLEEQLAEESEAFRRISDPRGWLAAIHGSVSAFMVVYPPYVDADFSAGVFVEASGDRSELDQLVDDTIEEIRKTCSESALEYAGVEMALFESPDEEVAYAIFFESESVCSFLAGDRRDELVDLAQGAIDRLSAKDAEGGLASSERLAEARAASGHARAIELLVDVAEFARIGEAEQHAEAARLAETEVTEPLPNPIAQRFGVYDIRWLHLGADFGEKESLDLHVALHLPEQSLLQQASRFFGSAPRELFAFAPSDCLSAQVGNVDVSGLWEFVLRTLEELAPEQHAAFSAGLEQAKVGMEIDFENDLIDQVSGDFMSFTMKVPADEIPLAQETVAFHSGEEDAQTTALGYAYLVALEDGVVVEDFVERMFEIGGIAPLIEFEEFQGHHLQSIEDLGFHWCFLDEFLVAGPSPTPVRTALTRIGAEDAPSILSDERYRTALAAHPGASFLHVGDSRANVETWLDVLESALGGIPPVELEGAEVDLASMLVPLLPDPTIVGKYLSGVSTNALEIETESLRFSTRAR